jgi:competence protein ComEC
MCSLMSIGGCFGRPVLSINSLTLAAFLMLGFNPLLLHDVGFQLSYISVLAIYTLAVPCNRKCQEYLYEQFHSKSAFTKACMLILEYFCGIAIVSLVCTLATAPLVAYHFHTIPLLSVLANLLVCLLASVLLYAVALWWILFWWNGARLLLTEVLETIALLMNTVAEWISSVSWATLNWSPSKIQVLLSYALIVSVATYLYRRTATSLKLTLVILVALLATFL